jgi:hypothetical protein
LDLDFAMTVEGEAETRDMQMALGQAISGWAMIEGNLCQLFALALGGGGKGHRPAIEVFCAVLSFETQLAMTRKAVETAFQKDKAVLASWGILWKRVDALRPMRNKLAHGQIIRVERGDEWSVDFLPFYHMGASKSNDAYIHWSVTDLRKIREGFNACGKHLWNLHFDLLTGAPPRQLSLEPMPQLGRPPSSKRFRSDKPGSR